MLQIFYNHLKQLIFFTRSDRMAPFTVELEEVFFPILDSTAQHCLTQINQLLLLDTQYGMFKCIRSCVVIPVTIRRGCDNCMILFAFNL